MRLPGNLRDGLHVRLLISLVVTGAIVLPLLLLGRAQANALNIECFPSPLTTASRAAARPSPPSTPSNKLPRYVKAPLTISRANHETA